MKKGLLVLSSLAALVVMTGCGGKKLTCTMDNNSLGLETKSTVEVKFKKDVVDSMKVAMDITIPDEYKDQKDELIEEFKKSEENVKVTETKNGIKVEADSSSNSDFFDDLDFDDKEVSYDDAKKAFEAQGYTCK